MHILRLETLLSILDSIPTACIYALVNESTKRFQVYSSTNTPSHLLSLIRRIKSDPKEFLLREDLGGCILVILETKNMSRNRQLELINEYVSRGYSQYRMYSPIRYKLKTEVDTERRAYCLYLVNSKGNHKVLVGVFRKHRELQKFVDTHYAKGITKIVKHSSCR
jgi:hypothetical protein